MAVDQVELLILAGIVLVMMVVLGVLKHLSRKQGLHQLGKRGPTRRVMRARQEQPNDDEHP